ncbi:hypothetical protein C6P46_000847 [Rhodotorula mucilaginosa]|uniref:Major facilitator superfamily (MFS) profile domain-containing protein n=1 Tax=Rhodotorula mucilaginosa TaxID=5537 RepID=A0A9P6VVP6_RHOMI|nr:hypothetical protein C6P46_000847 [Rhodotorula mucilaginosa]TKA50662.1 hypothetical protein B0A53_06179 [Rhodotorula sp. CCFEE 5036]
MSSADGLQFKQEIYHDEKVFALDEAGQALRAEARSPWKVLRENARAVAVVLAVQSSAIIVGIEFSLPGNLLAIPAFLRQFGSLSEKTGKYAIASKHLTIWAALFATFQVLGLMFGGQISDRFGRRGALYLVLFFIYIGVMLEIIATTWQMWLGSKIVIGFGTGIMQTCVVTYVSEVAPRELRGSGLGLFNMAMNIGGLAATLIPWGTQKHYGVDPTDNRAFRVPLYVAIACPTITLVLQLLLLVESPWWLMMKGCQDQARKALDYLYGKTPGYDSDKAVAELEYTLAKEAEIKAAAAGATYLDCFRGINGRRTFCAKDPLASSVIITAVGLACNFLSFFILESKHVGRWFLLFAALIVMLLCMLGIALIDVIANDNGNYTGAAGKMLTFFVALFTAGSTLGPGVAGWTYTGEAGSSRLRAKTATLGTAGNAVAGLVWTSVLPYLLDADEVNLGPKTGFIFFGFGVACVVLVWFFIPDLTGRTFAQIDELLARRIPARKFSKTETTGDYGNNLDETAQRVEAFTSKDQEV